MSLSSATVQTLPSVKADLNYLAPTLQRPRTYTYDPPPGIPRPTVVNEPHKVAIADARPILGDVYLDEEGFGLVRHPSAVGDFYDDQQVKSVYYPEAERVLKEATGAERIFIFDHTVRRRVPGAEDRQLAGLRQPVPRVHVHHTAKSGPQRVRDLLPEDAERLLGGRVQIVNLWRPIRGPLEDAPLAVCDASSVEPEQLVPSDLVYPNRVWETYSVVFDPRHRWFYVPRMEREE